MDKNKFKPDYEDVELMGETLTRLFQGILYLLTFFCDESTLLQAMSK
ncbi:hypothetical protein [Xanthocytophaga agilis]|uniref:Uncharacterized protein n=1 Tax=Xanthocytophaga agilis TaxID=3048010 RepID=A0AAE3UEG1_9BACT|nr:hypothetical protein [Xanthocytophaga agilis]MDJ1502753.1 hypothetical protein [Xanthocytophaga agilis]